MEMFKKKTHIPTCQPVRSTKGSNIVEEIPEAQSPIEPIQSPPSHLGNPNFGDFFFNFRVDLGSGLTI